MGRDTLFPEEWEIAKSNAIILLEKVNLFCDEFLPGEILHVRSGFRPSAINSKTPKAAKKSLHIIGKAIDLADNSKILKAKIQPDKNMIQAQRMRELGLFMEHPDETLTWLHLDIGDRPDRPSRTFRIK